MPFIIDAFDDGMCCAIDLAQTLYLLYCLFVLEQDSQKRTYLDIYKMDLAETMKSVLAKSTGGSGNTASTSSAAPPHGGEGYVTEKLYMLLQLYLQNKGWSSIELLQCFSDLKESSMLPSAAYLQ